MQVSFNGFASGINVATSAINMTLGQWYYIAMTRSGSTFSLYIDGALIGSITNATAHNGATKNVLIGGILGSLNYSADHGLTMCESQWELLATLPLFQQKPFQIHKP
jgi:hypothetical protein